MNTDEFFERIRQDELEDQLVATPVQYSHIRPISSPQVYGFIRRGRLQVHTCVCGRNVIVIAEADALLRELGKLPPLEETMQTPSGNEFSPGDEGTEVITGTPNPECVHVGIECDDSECPCSCGDCPADEDYGDWDDEDEEDEEEE
jgi:hypothetical protein